MNLNKNVTPGRTDERINPALIVSRAEFIIYQKHLCAYESAAAKITSGDSVIEIGCGEGYGTRIISKGSKRVVGLDCDSGLIEYANRNYGNEHCSFSCYDGASIPHPDNSFDVAISFQVIEHVREDKSFLSEICRVLKPGGRLLLTTPNGAVRVSGGERPWNRFHIREYYPDQLASLASSAGFARVEMEGITVGEPVFSAELERYRAARLRSHTMRARITGLLPPATKEYLVRIKSKLFPRPKEDAARIDQTPVNFYIDRSNREKWLDLLVTATK